MCSKPAMAASMLTGVRLMLMMLALSAPFNQSPSSSTELMMNDDHGARSTAPFARKDAF